MRTLALLLLVVLSLLLVLKFFPSAEEQSVEAALEDQSARADVFVPRPDLEGLEQPDENGPAGDGADGSMANEQTPQEATPRDELELTPLEGPEEQVPTATPGQDDDGERLVWDPRLEVALAGAALHGTQAELDGAIAALGRSLPGERAALARAFHRALAGDLRGAQKHAQAVSASAATDEERRLLELALGGRGAVPRPAAYGTRGEGPLARAMAIGLREQRAAEDLEDGAYPDAARGYSEVLLAALDSPWRTARADLHRWSTALHRAQDSHRWNPRGAWPSEELTVQSGDSLVAIRLRYLEGRDDALMCTGLIQHANGLSGSTIHPGDPLRIPTAKVTVLVDLSERWLLYMHDGEVVYAWECGVGREGEETITGAFTVGAKVPEPPWMRVGHDTVPYGHPDNPLGTHWITWLQDGRKTSYGFHGTWEPETLGSGASDGCIRLHNDHIALLYEILPQGSPFVVRD